MDESFWRKQTDEPLWPELEWSRPQQKRGAKKLVIVGGHAHGFDAVGRLYQAALSAGIGHAKAVLPKELRSVVGSTLPDTVFANLTPESKDVATAKAELAAYSDWGDGVALIQTGNNSKTALLVNDWLTTYPKPIVLGDDAVDLLKHDLTLYEQRADTLFVLSFAGLQKIVAAIKSPLGLRHDMGLRPLVLALRTLGEQMTAPLVVTYEETVAVLSEGQVVTTRRTQQPDPVMLAGFCATWWLQQPGKTLEALAQASYNF